MMLISVAGKAQCSRQPSPHAIMLPALNGGGGFDLLNTLPGGYSRTSYSTLQDNGNIDLGQDFCIRDFEKQFRNDRQAKGNKN